MGHLKHKRIFPIKHCYFFVILLGFFITLNVQAATLNFYPATQNIIVGNIVKVDVSLNTQSVPINSVESKITFPSDLLEIVSIAKTNSILSFWVEEPSYSNITGSISFVGGLTNPGYNGANGKILEIVFKVKKAGTASLIFSNSIVRANDGLGTNVLQGVSQAVFTLNEQIQKPVIEPVEDTPPLVGLPKALVISSPTNPDQSKWYNNSRPKFVWDLPADITAVRLVFNKNAISIPSILYTPPISEKELTDLKDGIFYFHAQGKNNNGWGGISHFKFSLDTVKPNLFTITEIVRVDITEPQAMFDFKANDELSGIDYYEIQLDDLPVITWRDDGSHQYQTPALEVDKHTLIAKAYDMAGNFASASAVFNIDSIQIPIITEYPKELSNSDNLVIRGKASPDYQVILSLKKEGEEINNFTLEVSKNGEFVFIDKATLADGIYNISVYAVDSRGAKSLSSEGITIIIKKPLLLKAGLFAFNFLTILVPLIALIVLLILILWSAWHKFKILRKRIQKETREAEKGIQKSFDVLKDELGDCLRILRKAKTERELTNEEDKIVKQVKKALEKAESSIEKEIADIEKQIK
jgi:heme exporter protein D